MRGALLYNYWVKHHGIENRFELIREGDKIKFIYLKMPNKIGENIIAFPSTLPLEFDVHRFVDYNTMFDKLFIDPLSKILDALQWSPRPVATLDSLF